MAAGKRRYRCEECGGIGEIADKPDGEKVAGAGPPRCEHCGEILLRVTWLADDADGGDVTGELPDALGGEQPGSSVGPCTCEAGGGPMSDDPTRCFICGGSLPAAGVESERAQGDAPETFVDAESHERSGRPGEAPDGAREAIRRSCVLVLADGRRVRVGDGILVGRRNPSGVGAGVVPVRHPTVSRTHAWLRETGEGVEVVDLASTNGTWVGTLRLDALRAHTATVDREVSISFGRSLMGKLVFE